VNHKIKFVSALVPFCLAVAGLLSVGCFLFAGGGGGGGGGNEPNQPPVSATQALFDQVWLDFHRNYSHFGAKNVNWDTLGAQYRPNFAGNLGPAAFAAALAPMLAELEDLHVSLFDATGQVVDTYSRPAERNWLNAFPQTYFPNGVTKLKGTYPVLHGWMNDNIAYILIDNFYTDEWGGLNNAAVAAIEELFATYAGADGMIVDARSNNGGNENVAKAIAGHFTNSKITYGYTKDRTPGNNRNAFEARVAHVLQPAASNRFLKPTILLMGQFNMSSAEWFVLMMMECPAVEWTIGDSTRGSSGNPQEFSLSNGVSYLIPSWVAYDRYMLPIEDVGVDPLEWIASDESYNDAAGIDYVLDAALDWMALLTL